MELDNTTLAFLKYKNGIRKFCRLYAANVRMEVADLESEMYAVLHKCVLSYDPDKGASFNTLLWGAVYNRYRTIIIYNGRGKRAGYEVLVDTQSCIQGDEEELLFPNQYAIMREVEQITMEASAEDTCLALRTVHDRMSDPSSHRRMVSARQFNYVS